MMVTGTSASSPRPALRSRNRSPVSAASTPSLFLKSHLEKLCAGVIDRVRPPSALSRAFCTSAGGDARLRLKGFAAVCHLPFRPRSRLGCGSSESSSVSDAFAIEFLWS
jgi:hypothetical protein